jgi:hypothetical protein
MTQATGLLRMTRNLNKIAPFCKRFSITIANCKPAGPGGERFVFWKLFLAKQLRSTKVGPEIAICSPAQQPAAKNLCRGHDVVVSH